MTSAVSPEAHRLDDVPEPDKRSGRPGLRYGIALAVVLLAAAAFNLWGLAHTGYDSYYGASARSGAHSWKAFFYGSLDTGNFITIDKPPLVYWLQSLTARVIGFNAWSVLLPGALAGVAATAVLARTVKLVWGELAAIIAAAVFALTPVTVAMARSNHPDMVLTLMMTLAAWGWVSAVRTGRTAPLVWAGAALGLGFMAKMWAVFIPVPVLAVVFVVVAPGSLRRRFGQLAASGVVTAVVGGAWMAAVALTPTADRPFLGSSSSNNIWQVSWDYNGPGRMFGSDQASSVLPPGMPAKVLGATPGFGRMLAPDVAGQVMWLVPLALVGLVAGLWIKRRAGRADLGLAAFVMWGGWTVLHLLVFSFDGSQWHAYYTVTLAPAIAALVGGGLTLMIRHRLVLTTFVGLALTVVWDVVLLGRTPHYMTGLKTAVAVFGAVGVVLTVVDLAITRRAGATTNGKKFAGGAAALAMAAALAGPIAYDVTTDHNGSPAGLLNAGPLDKQVVPEIIWESLPEIRHAQGFDPKMISYLEQNRGKARWLLAVPDGPTAGALILATGQPVMAMGGFRDTDPALPVAKLQSLVQQGELRFVLLTSTLGGVTPPSYIVAEDNWLRNHCSPVGGGQQSANSQKSANSQNAPALLDCAPR